MVQVEYRSLETRATLSRAPRPTFHPRAPSGWGPGSRFFHLIRLPLGRYDIGTQRENPSLDFSILHVLSKNPHLFSGVHDNSLMDGLTRAVPKKFQSTNIQMLSREEEARIEERFRDENLWLLNTYGNGMDVDHIYRTYFTPREAKVSYSSTAEMDSIYRCLGIILESLADQVPAVSRPSQISERSALNGAQRLHRRIRRCCSDWVLGKFRREMKRRDSSR
jgi:hypothetical protein